MENQEQHNKIIGAMIAVFILMTVVTTVTAIMFLTEKNKLVKQNQIANDIILKYNNVGSKNVTPRTNASLVGDATANDSGEEVLDDAELAREREAYLDRKAARKAQLELMSGDNFEDAMVREDEAVDSEIPEEER